MAEMFCFLVVFQQQGFGKMSLQTISQYVLRYEVEGARLFESIRSLVRRLLKLCTGVMLISRNMNKSENYFLQRASQ